MRRTTLPLLSVTALMLALCVLPGCSVTRPTAWVTTEEELEFDLDGIEQFSMTTHSGLIDTVAGDDPNIARLVVTVKAGGFGEADAQACLDAIELAVTRQGDHDQIQDIRWDYVKSRHPNWSAQVAYHLEIPPTMAVYAKTHNGKVAVSGIAARCELHCHNGPVEVDDAGDAGLIAHTHNGKVVVTTDSADVDLQTHNGSVEATLTNPSQLAGSVTTHNGSLNLSLNADSSAQLVCRTHNGRIKSDVPLRGVTVEKRTRLEGVLGDGGQTLELRTHNGSVTLATL